MMRFKFCPLCATPLSSITGEHGKILAACVEGCKKFIDWNNPVPCVAVVCPVFKTLHRIDYKIEPNSGNAVILVKRGMEPAKGMWCLPCGYIDEREDPEEAAKREVREETGLEVKIIGLLDACPSADQKLNNLIIFYLAQIIGGECKPGDDAVDSGAFTKDNLPEMAFETHKDIILSGWNRDNDYLNNLWMK